MLPFIEEPKLTHKEPHVSTPILFKKLALTHQELHVNAPICWEADIGP